jgi:pimeloyl-ACP methyl ester carboxylesterase
MTRDVVVLHGLWMNRYAMLPLAWRLTRAGFVPHALTYRSFAHGLADHVARVARLVAEVGAPRVHVVAHSMGGVVAAAYLAQAGAGVADRIVLLGSPVAGCRAGRVLSGHPALGAALGASAEVWRNHEGFALPKDVTAGAIAGVGRVGVGRFFVDLPEPNDGVVMVSETRVSGLADHLVLPVSHSAMLVDRVVAHETVHFLRHGRFEPRS